jgi:hypothetical protein
MNPYTNLTLSALAAGLLSGVAVSQSHDWWVIIPGALSGMATAIVQQLRADPRRPK